MPSFYPSSSAFMVGDVVVTKYDSGCLRSILIKSKGIREKEIAPIYQKVGALAENLRAAELDASGREYEREVVLRTPLSPAVMFSGRADFVVNGEIVDEVKGHISKNTRRDVIRKGEYNLSYLAQLVSYMVRLRLDKGRLICGYFEEDVDGSLIKQEERTFKVEIGDDGGISVDSEPSGYCVADLLAHQQAAVKVLETDEVGPRPDKWNQKYGGPCTLCPFQSACDKYDRDGITTKEFFTTAQSCLDDAPPKPSPAPFKVTKLKGKK